MKNRRFSLRSATTSPRRRHGGATPAESPQPPHAATVPTPGDAFTGQYHYDAATLTGLYAEGRELLSSAEVNEQQANNLLAQIDALLGLAARQRVQAADRFRLLKLAELDAVTPEGAAWPSPAPQVPAEPAPVVHFSDNVSFWPPCGARTEATWQTVNPAAVTCEACLSSMAAAVATSGPASQDGDTVPMRAVRTCIAGVERDGVVYHCTSDEGHEYTHFNPRIGHFETAAEAVAYR